MKISPEMVAHFQRTEQHAPSAPDVPLPGRWSVTHVDCGVTTTGRMDEGEPPTRIEQLGAEGWEPFGIEPITIQGTSNRVRIWFKRPT
jgi:hypothetical protein